eukprot:gene3001-18760_t
MPVRSSPVPPAAVQCSARLRACACRRQVAERAGGWVWWSHATSRWHLTAAPPRAADDADDPPVSSAPDSVSVDFHPTAARSKMPLDFVATELQRLTLLFDAAEQLRARRRRSGSDPPAAARAGAAAISPPATNCSFGAHLLRFDVSTVVHDDRAATGHDDARHSPMTGCGESGVQVYDPWQVSAHPDVHPNSGVTRSARSRFFTGWKRTPGGTSPACA